MKQCDIIIPIYNAYDCLKECVDSVIQNTDLKNDNSLILIDDKSPDERIKKYLEILIDEYKDINIKVLYNDVNLGFVGTVNKGMKYSKNDVLLLNSDTEVPPNWIDNIKKCAYSEKNVASVTPLSNNATLVSVPEGLQVNDIPQNMSFKEYAKLVNDVSFNSYPVLPTAHGFCMYIRREALNNVGYFDEKTFGKGYGEENDFSYRCLDYGYKHLLCDNTIVYHKESQSFSESKEALINNNMKILQKRYPNYVSKTDLWLKQFPIKNICKNIKYAINIYNKKNILFLVHDWSNVTDNVGGTTIHCYDLIKSLRKECNVHVLAPENGIYKLCSYFENIEEIMYFPGIYNSSTTNLYNQKYKDMLFSIVDGLNIGLIHIHHMIGHYFDIIDVAKERNIRTIYTVHDFYCLCPSINMLYNMEKYCVGLENKNCAECLNRKLGINHNIIRLWRTRWEDFLSKIDEVITPSESTKYIIENEFSTVKCKAIEHGINLDRRKAEQHNNDCFNIAFVGVMAKHKGAEVIENIINQIDDKQITFHVFGDSEYKSLKKNKKNYIYHGRYKREELPILFEKNNIDLVCNLSIWPETYSYTLTETIACGVPVLSYDIGAVAERIKKYNFGWVVPISSNVDDLTSTLKSIKEDADNYLSVIKNINTYKIKNVEEMVDDYLEIYNIKEIDKIDSKVLFEKQIQKNEVFDSSLDQILNSRRWKLVSKIEIPEFAKKIVKKIIK